MYDSNLSGYFLLLEFVDIYGTTFNTIITIYVL